MHGMMKASALIVIFTLFSGAAWAQTIEVTNAWVRAPAPGGESAAAYLTLVSDHDDTLIGVDATGFGMAMFHLSKRVNGVSTMTDLDHVALPAKTTVSFAPGGMHIMLMEFKTPPRPGNQVALTLHFLRAKDITVNADIYAIGMKPK